MALPAAPWGQYLRELTGLGAIKAAHLELVHAQVLFRHGARAPFQDSPEDPKIWRATLRSDVGSLPSLILQHLRTGERVDASMLRNSNFSPTENLLGGGLEKGTLTDAGIRQARSLGRRLGERYRAAGIVAGHHEKEVLLRSSFTKRTVETMQGVVAGMFPDNATAPMRVLVGSNGEGSAHTDYLHHHPDCCARFKKLLGRCALPKL